MIGRYYLHKTCLCLLIGVLLLAMHASMAAIQVQMNGEMLEFSVQPVQIGGRTMVPLRGIFEALGAKVNWDARRGPSPLSAVTPMCSSA